MRQKAAAQATGFSNATAFDPTTSQRRHQTPHQRFAAPHQMSMTHRTTLGSKTYTLQLKGAATETGKDALIFEGEAVTTDEGTALTKPEKPRSAKTAKLIT